MKPWMLSNLDRMHIYVPATSLLVLVAIEMYVRARIGERFRRVCLAGNASVLESVAVTEIQVFARVLCLVRGSRDYTAVRPDTDHSTLDNQRGHPFPIADSGRLD